MIYISAMRVRSTTDGLGINIDLHHSPGRAPEEFWTIWKNPGPSLEEVSWVEIKSGGNSVEAFLDLVIDDDDYSQDLIERALEGLSDTIEGGARNPFPWTFRGEGGRSVHMVFSVNIGLEDLDTKRRVLRGLSDKIRRWLSQHDTTISSVIGRSAA